MIKIGIVGTGSMAGEHAKNFKATYGCKVVACCDIDKKKAIEFAKKHEIKHVINDAETLFSSGLVDAVSIVTPDNTHTDLAIKALKHNLHVLSEKPLATNPSDAHKMVEAASEANTINMVNLSYRNAPAIHKAKQLIDTGKLGKIRHFEARYFQSWLSSDVWGAWNKHQHWLWRLSSKHGSLGVLGDVGVHILDFATYPLGSVKNIDCRLKVFDKAPDNRIGEYEFDVNDSAVITAEMSNGAIGVIHTSRYATGYQNALRLSVFGTEGALIVDLDKSKDTLEVCLGNNRHKTQWKTLKAKQTPDIYHRFIKSIKTAVNDQPDFKRGAEIQDMMGACFRSDEIGRHVEL